MGTVGRSDSAGGEGVHGDGPEAQGGAAGADRPDRRDLSGMRGGSTTWGTPPCPATARWWRSWATSARSSTPASAGGRTCTWGTSLYHTGDLIESLHDRLTHQIARALRHDCQASRTSKPTSTAEAQRLAIRLLDSLPALRETLDRGRPGRLRRRPRRARNLDEILFCYPGVSAITVFRIAHELLQARRAADPPDDDRVRPRQDRHRHPPRRGHRPPLLHRPRHRRRHRRDDARSATASRSIRA